MQDVKFHLCGFFFGRMADFPAVYYGLFSSQFISMWVSVLCQVANKSL